MADDELQGDLADLSQWIDDCRQHGWTVPDSILANREGYVREHGRPCRCASCDIPVMHEECWTEGSQIPLGHVTHDWERLCESCNDGEAGHHEYHHRIEQTERDRHHEYAPNLPRGERRSAHEAFKSIAEKEHLACPWVARGEECEKVEEIKFRQAEHASEYGVDEDAEPGAAADGGA